MRALPIGGRLGLPAAHPRTSCPTRRRRSSCRPRVSLGLRRPGRSRAVVPRARHAAAAPVLGRGCWPRGGVHAARLVAGVLPRPGDRADGALFNLLGDGAARRARSAAAHVDSKRRPADDRAVFAARDLRVQLRHAGAVPRRRRQRSSTSPSARASTLAVVGESGSGKSVRCWPRPACSPPRVARSTGRALLAGRDLLSHVAGSELRHSAGRRVGFVFQDPMTSLNPVMTVGRQIVEGVARRTGDSRADARAPRRRTARPGRHPRPGAAALDRIRTSSPAACGSG